MWLVKAIIVLATFVPMIGIVSKKTRLLQQQTLLLVTYVACSLDSQMK